MRRRNPVLPFLALCTIAIAMVSCDSLSSWGDLSNDPAAREQRLRQQIERKVKTSIDASSLIGIDNKREKLHESTTLKVIYEDHSNDLLWLENGRLTQAGDTLVQFISRCKYYGLYRSDYHYPLLQILVDSLQNDTLLRENSGLLAATDVLISDAAVTMARHLALGRLPADSVTLRQDTVLSIAFYQDVFKGITRAETFRETILQLEPKHNGYHDLKAALRHFLDSAGEIKPYTFIRYPHVDSLRTLEQLGKRLCEEKLFDQPDLVYDTIALHKVLKNYQHSQGLKETGKVNENTIKKLNNTSWEHFKTIAINLDRYKLLPDTMPAKYVLVNIPSYYLRLIDADTLALLSRVVVGKSVTPTPLLNSKLSNIVTYPQWNIPVSIIKKELLPNLKKNPTYLTKKGYRLITQKGVALNPDTIPWNIYKERIPYRVVQPGGDDNSLGILKFNFNNKFDVYLHDTDQRYLFRNENRSLSHGCVRVQEWKKLAHYILQVDSMSLKLPKPEYAPTDTLNAWLTRKERHTIPVKNSFSIFIRYFSCEGKEGRVQFYQDIYGLDSKIKDEYFSSKTVL